VSCTADKKHEKLALLSTKRQRSSSTASGVRFPGIVDVAADEIVVGVFVAASIFAD
jgi:hypothetical protein